MEKNMTEGNIVKIIICFSVPMILSALLQQLYHMIDIIIAGNFIGEHAITAIGCTSAISVFIVNVFNGLTAGVSIQMAGLYGGGKEQQIPGVTSFYNKVLLVLSVVIGAAGVWLCRPLLIFFDTPADILESAIIYLTVVFCGLPFQVLYSEQSAVLRGVGNSRYSLYAIIAASVSNIVLDMLFIYVFSLGILGAALATILAQLMSALYLFWVIKTRMPIFRSSDDVKESVSNLLLGFRIGVPIAFQQSIMNSGGLLSQNAINSFGTRVVAGLTTAYKIDNLAMLPVINIGAAITTFVAQNKSAGKKNRAMQGVITGLFLAVGISILVVAGILLPFRSYIGLFGVSDGVSAFAYEFLLTCSCFYPLFALENVLNGYLQGFGYVKTAVAGHMTGLVVRTIILYAFYQTIGYSMIAYSEICGWFITTLLLLGGICNCKKKSK